MEQGVLVADGQLGIGARLEPATARLRLVGFGAGTGLNGSISASASLRAIRPPTGYRSILPLFGLDLSADPLLIRRAERFGSRHGVRSCTSSSTRLRYGWSRLRPEHLMPAVTIRFGTRRLQQTPDRSPGVRQGKGVATHGAQPAQPIAPFDNRNLELRVHEPTFSRSEGPDSFAVAP